MPLHLHVKEKYTANSFSLGLFYQELILTDKYREGWYSMLPSLTGFVNNDPAEERAILFNKQ